MKNSLLKGIIIPVLILFTIMIHAQNYHVYVSSASMEDNAGIYRYSFNENKGNL